MGGSHRFSGRLGGPRMRAGCVDARRQAGVLAHVRVGGVYACRQAGVPMCACWGCPRTHTGRLGCMRVCVD